MLSAAVILFSLDKIGWIGTPLQTETVTETNPVSDRYSLAVLPFTNRSNLAENAYFVDGVHDDLLTMLARFNSFSVTSRTSVLRYQDSKMSIPEISAELGVSHILEGAVQRDGDHIRVNAQLINAGRDDHLWAETFDRELSTASLFEIQSSIARAIAAALNTKLSNADEHRLDSIPTGSLEAYDAYLLGKQSLLGNSVDAYEAALVHFEDALALDESFAGAYAGLCETHLGLYGKSGDPIHFKAAETACEQALAIDADLTEVHVALGSLFFRHGDFQLAEDKLRSALASEPENIDAMVELGLTLAEQGRIREAETVLLEAESYRALGENEDAAREAYARAIPLAESRLEINDQDWRTIAMLGTYYVHSDRQDDARKQIESALSISKRNPEALLYAALVSNALGEKEMTLTLLEEMVERDDSYRNFVIEEPDLQVLRGNERFESLINP